MPLGFLAIDPLLPPASLAVLALLALLLSPRLPREWGRRIAIACLVPLVLLAVPSVSAGLLSALDPPRAAPIPPGAEPTAIVILSADSERGADDAPLDVGSLTLERERAGAALARRTGLPILVTGGVLEGTTSLGDMMAASLASDFGLTVRWIENRSATTWENAQFSAPMLRASGVGRVYLVTHAWHMRRSLLAFRRAGIDAVPAPVREDPGFLESSSFVPRTSSWMRAFFAIHEWVGLAWYTLRPDARLDARAAAPAAPQANH